MLATFTCTNCRRTVTEPVQHAIQLEIIASLGACCAACCRTAYAYLDQLPEDLEP